MEETRHHLARTPPVYPEHSHVVSLPPFRSLSSATEHLDSKKHSPLSSKPSWVTTPTTSSLLACANAATMSWNTVLHGVPACTPCLTSLATSFCRQRRHEPSWCRDAKPSSGSRTVHPLSMTLKALVRDLLPPFGHPAVRWSSGCTRTSLGALQALPSVFSRFSFSVTSGATTSSSVAASPEVSAGFVGVPGVSSWTSSSTHISKARDRLCPLDLGYARGFSAHLDVGCFKRLLVSDPLLPIVSLNTRSAAAPVLHSWSR